MGGGRLETKQKRNEIIRCYQERHAVENCLSSLARAGQQRRMIDWSSGLVSLVCDTHGTCVHDGTTALNSVACGWRSESIHDTGGRVPQRHPAPSVLFALDSKTVCQRQKRFHERIAYGT